MKLLGGLRCRWFGCGPHARHALDHELDLYVCECCGATVLDAPAGEQQMWSGYKYSVSIEPDKPGHVWYCEERDQARVRL